ncbi:WG repeat-containing protein [[Empedobacter] haloabium]|uniref:WG repeat-containing protein n=1 Tax=[Empedobacter] haloabium TaxID=592317 RepID=A0ABZ1UH14_9BURK
MMRAVGKRPAVLCLATLSILLAGPPAIAAAHCPKGGDDWPDACFVEQAGERYVKRQYLDRLKWNRQGYALVSRADAFELMAVNRQGKVVVPGIYHTGDFDYPDAERGVGRFATLDGKCGYFQARGFKVVVPARYDVCRAFHDGWATACTGCTRYCDDEDCHMDHLVGGQADQLGLDGTVRQSYPLATLDTVCGSPERRKLTQRAGTTLLQCVRDPGPFDHLR